MTKADRDVLIERMEEIGDMWDDADVKRVYGNKSLQEALDDRMGDLTAFANIIGKVINR